MSDSTSSTPSADSLAYEMWGPSWQDVGMFLSQLKDVSLLDLAKLQPTWVSEVERTTNEVSATLQNVVSQFQGLLSGKAAGAGNTPRMGGLSDPTAANALADRIKQHSYGPASIAAGAAQIALGTAHAAGLIPQVERVQAEVTRLTQEKKCSPALTQWLGQVAVGYATGTICPRGAYTTEVRAVLVDDWDRALDTLATSTDRDNTTGNN